MKRKDGFIDIDSAINYTKTSDIQIVSLRDNSKIVEIFNFEDDDINFSFNYNGTIYYFKYDKLVSPYDELIAEELATDFNIPHASYDLAIWDDKKGVVSANFKLENVNYIEGEEILLDYYKKNNTDAYNNLEGIWDALEYRYRQHLNKQDIIEKLMKQIIDVFLFDIITMQLDRHSNNWQIMESSTDINIAPIFDNERILMDSICSLTVEEKLYGNLFENLRLFLNVSNEEYINIIRDKLWIISEANLNSIFKRVEERTGIIMPKNEKNYYLEGYDIHREKLHRILSNIEISRKR